MGTLKKQIKKLVKKESFSYRCMLLTYRIYSLCVEFIHDNFVYMATVKGIIHDIQKNVREDGQISIMGGAASP